MQERLCTPRSISKIMRTENLVLDARASSLLQLLNQRYLGFVNELPDPLKRVALNRETYMGEEFLGSFSGPGEMNPFMTCTPWLFWETFQVLEDDLFLDIAEAGAYYALAMVVMDHLVDGHYDQRESIAVFHQALHERSHACFRRIFAHEVAFWDEFARFSNLHLDGLSAELNSREGPELIDEDTFKRISRGKVSPIAVTILALSIASDQAELIKPIFQSLCAVAFGTQMLDDIGDWQDDIETEHWTYFNALVSMSHRRDGSIARTIDECCDFIEREWLDIIYLDQVIAWLGEGLTPIKHIACKGWKSYIYYYLDFAQEKRDLAASKRALAIIEPLVKSERPRDQ